MGGWKWSCGSYNLIIPDCGCPNGGNFSFHIFSILSKDMKQKNRLSSMENLPFWPIHIVKTLNLLHGSYFQLTTKWRQSLGSCAKDAVIGPKPGSEVLWSPFAGSWVCPSYDWSRLWPGSLCVSGREWYLSCVRWLRSDQFSPLDARISGRYGPPYHVVPGLRGVFLWRYIFHWGWQKPATSS